MKNHFEYKGYLGSAEVDAEGCALVGKLLFIRDTITYSATSVGDLERAFREAVDDYLQTCAELGDEADTPCKGTFNVRVGPTRHRDVAVAARTKGMGLNEFVCAALDASLAESHVVKHLHRHELIVGSSSEPKEVVATTAPFIWENAGGTAQH